MLKKIKDWLTYILGLYKNSEYIANYQREANVRSSAYMAGVMIILEIWMIVRYFERYILDQKQGMAFFFNVTKNFWILLAVAIAMFIYACMFLSGKTSRFKKLSNVWITLYSIICLSFGIYVSFYDFLAGKMITCFLTMALFVACLLIWRPYVSIIILFLIFYGFHMLLAHKAVGQIGPYGQELEILSGDHVNYIMYFISLTMIAISIYFQRYREAKKAESLEIAAITDDLTGAPNMVRFNELATNYVNQSFESGQELIYLFFNIENFKTFNDQLGYHKGNEMIQVVADIMKETFPDEPYARQGDDHFVALTKVSDFKRKIEIVRESISLRKEYELYLHVKVGGYKAQSPDEDARIAIDRARYACGFLKNRPDEYYFEYDEALGKKFKLRQYVLNNIDKAVRNGYIKVFYQPVVWSKNGKLCGCEALARWIDPEFGFLSPGDFVPVLEECRQIHKLDKCVYEIVCQNMRNSMDKGLPILPTSLNFSRLDFELMDAVEVLESLVKKYGIARENLHVEITESALTSDIEGLKHAMDDLRSKGYALWLDDFGSGYSSMNVLKDFKFDLLKIDMVFLRRFSENENSRKILKSIIELSDSLGMTTLTEGVETEDAVQFLNEAGCGRLQGYYYGKPMPYDEICQKIQDGVYEVSTIF